MKPHLPSAVNYYPGRHKMALQLFPGDDWRLMNAMVKFYQDDPSHHYIETIPMDKIMQPGYGKQINQFTKAVREYINGVNHSSEV